MEDEKKVEAVLANPERAVPKYCTNVSFGKLPNGDVVMSFLHRSGKDGPLVLIETIVVDEIHTRKIVEALQGLSDKGSVA